ncbi:MAG: diacylglycerol kinase family protein, partial [Parcubacteria group bacterium]
MFFYVYDKLVGNKKNAKKFGQMQAKLNELGILNDKGEVGTVNTINSIVDSALISGRHHNIIAVGNDATAYHTINAILKSKVSNKKTVFGLIPFEPSHIADTLGMPSDIEKACLAISRSKLENIDVAYTSDGTCFINSL